MIELCHLQDNCDLLWRNREQVATDIWLISGLVQTNSVGYYGQW